MSSSAIKNKFLKHWHLNLITGKCKLIQADAVNVKITPQIMAIFVLHPDTGI